MRVRVLLASALLGGLLNFSLSLKAEDSKSSVTLQKTLDSQFVPTKMSADKQDMVSSGSALVLHKDGLVLYGLKSPQHPACTYENDKISPAPSARTLTPTKTLVEGEKVWMTKVSVTDDGVFFAVITEPNGADGRYWGELKIPFPQGHIPADDEILKTIAEVVTVDVPSGDAPKEGAAQPLFEHIFIPDDAPSEEPKTISKGQTKEQVDAVLGSPKKLVKLPNKVIAFYPGLEVTYVDGKVFDVQ